MHRTVKRKQILCRLAEVNGTKTKSLRCGRAERLINDKRAGQGTFFLPDSQSLSIGVLSDDFATVDLREDYATIADPKKQIQRCRLLF